MPSHPFLLADGSPKTVIVTGGAGDIGAETIRTYYEKGCNVVIADLSSAIEATLRLLTLLPDHTRTFYHPVNVVDWQSMKSLFRATKDRFGQVDIVIANAGMMESEEFYNFQEDDNGELKEPVEAHKVIDVNLKGTMNTLQLAMHSMKSNPPDGEGSRGSVILIASTSGYFGGTGVVSYVTSKHGVVGLGRASQRVANQLDIRVNVVAPFFTPTYITGGYSEKWKESGLPANTVESVAHTIVTTSVEASRKGHSVMVAGTVEREIETARTNMTKEWLGEEISDFLAQRGKFFEDLGGYPLPKPRG